LMNESAAHIFVVDRFGSLGDSLKGLLSSARNGAMGSIAFAPYSLNKFFPLEFSIHPRVAAALVLLSKTPSVLDLLRTAYEFQLTTTEEPVLDEIALSLSQILDYLERINAITYVRVDQPMARCKAAGINTKVHNSHPTEFISSKIPSELKIQAERMRELGFEEDFIMEALGLDAVPLPVVHDELEVISDAIQVQDLREFGDKDSIDADIKQKLRTIIHALNDKSLKSTGQSSRSALTALDKLRERTTKTILSDELENESIVSSRHSKVQHEEDLFQLAVESEQTIEMNIKVIDMSRSFRRVDCFKM
jgi:hypothetical protein